MANDLIRRAEAWLSSPEAMTAADDLISDLLAALKAQQPAPAGDDGLPPLPEPYIRIPNNGRGPMQVMEPFYSADQLRRAQREAMAVERERFHAIVADDAWAVTFQTFGQYRTALLRAIRQGASHD